MKLWLLITLLCAMGMARAQMALPPEFVLARQAFAERDYPRSLNLLNSMDSLQANKPEVLLLHAQVQLKLSRKDLALNAANRALMQDGQNADALLLRAKVRRSLGQYIAALADFDNALNIKPQDAEGWYYRGLTRIEINDRRNGCEDLTRAAQLGHEMAIDSKEVYCR